MQQYAASLCVSCFVSRVLCIVFWSVICVLVSVLFICQCMCIIYLFLRINYELVSVLFM